MDAVHAHSDDAARAMLLALWVYARPENSCTINEVLLNSPVVLPLTSTPSHHCTDSSVSGDKVPKGIAPAYCAS